MEGSEKNHTQNFMVWELLESEEKFKVRRSHGVRGLVRLVKRRILSIIMVREILELEW